MYLLACGCGCLLIKIKIKIKLAPANSSTYLPTYLPTGNYHRVTMTPDIDIDIPPDIDIKIPGNT